MLHALHLQLDVAQRVAGAAAALQRKMCDEQKVQKEKGCKGKRGRGDKEGKATKGTCWSFSMSKRNTAPGQRVTHYSCSTVKGVRLWCVCVGGGGLRAEPWRVQSAAAAARRSSGGGRRADDCETATMSTLHGAEVRRTEDIDAAAKEIQNLAE